MAIESKKTGLSLSGILRPTTPLEVAPDLTDQGADDGGQGTDTTDATPGAKPRKMTASKKAKAAAGAQGADQDGAKLYLSADVKFRLRMLAYQRGKTISTVANEVLDRHLPKWKLERTE